MRKTKRHKGDGRTSTDSTAGQVKPVTEKSAKTFARAPKKPQRDDPVADMRPTAHQPKEAKKAADRRALLKRLGHRVI